MAACSQTDCVPVSFFEGMGPGRRWCVYCRPFRAHVVGRLFPQDLRPGLLTYAPFGAGEGTVEDSGLASKRRSRRGISDLRFKISEKFGLAVSDLRGTPSLALPPSGLPSTNSLRG